MNHRVDKGLFEGDTEADLFRFIADTHLADILLQMADE